ncbi:MAG: hypothetical protein QM783_10005 [Phycisphaerales bacterium]
MDIRSWATLLIRCFGLYHLITSGATIFWYCTQRLATASGAVPAATNRYSEEPLFQLVLYPIVWCGISLLLLAYSDGLIRWLARVPGDAANKAA